jgi:coenzyme F420-reducing hydrogenase alpha subunit
MITNNDKIKKMVTEDASESKKPDENSEMLVEELIRIYDPITKKDFVVKKN